jgi:drug/metabolite transporter (DMT)-like permease
MILAAVTCFATMDTTVGQVGKRVPILALLWVRYGVQAVVMGLWVIGRRDAQGFRTAHPRFQLARGLLLLFSSAMTFLGLQRMPVPELTAINMLGPVLVTLLAVWLMGERITRLRMALVAGGFIGALIVIRPGSGLFGWAVLFPLASVSAYAVFQWLTSKLSGLESPYVTNFFTGLVGVSLLTLAVLLGGVDLQAAWRAATAADLLLMGLVGLTGTLGHLLLILAVDKAPTSTLMPFIYAQIGMAALLAWALFGHLPDGWSWLGMAVIAGCGAANVWLTMRAATRPVNALEADSIVD